MFYRYPAAATAENWLHDFLVTTIEVIHQNAAPRKRLLKWPDCIPTKHRNDLKNRRSLRDNLKKYEKAVRKLDQPARDRVLRGLKAQNQIEDLLAGTSDCDKLDDLDESVREPIKNLFNCAFGLLTDLKIRDFQYELIYESAENRVCPFCCCENLDTPNTPRYAIDDSDKQIREALDHYLSREDYPFAAANLKNLAPMGGRCNHYKHNTDVLRRKDGTRRKVFFPYAGSAVDVSLISSEPFSSKTNPTPAWSISFSPQCPEADTWNEIFFLEQRLRRNVLDPSYNRWLKDFCNWYVKTRKSNTPTNTQIVVGLKDYAELEKIKGLNGIEHYRVLVIEMLHHHCSRKNTRLLHFIKAGIQNAIPPKVHS